MNNANELKHKRDVVANMVAAHAAFHEAGHAVAKVHFGLGASAVEINTDGSGLSYGTGNSSVLSPACLAVLLAGPFVEARVARLSRAFVLLFGGGRGDYAQLKEHPLYMTYHRIAEKETNRFLRRAWPDIERVARALMAENKLPASEVARLAGEKRMYCSTRDFAHRWRIPTCP